MSRIVIIAWVGWQTLMLPVNLTVDRANGATERCCCCASASSCQCGCERPSKAADDDCPTVSRCECNDAPAVILDHSQLRDEQTRSLTAIDISDSTCKPREFAPFITSHLRGPPPDLELIQSTVLLV
ncbi:MAG: hypothetical protein H6819_01070 [Phycisphaerales bacterium]|nr:hypothetical protein [Phycisphaerales bacterium]MCB9857201.1 hypothetical protein [Phycisphaerales bacterium]MCB9863086.1 hypothetical protein [Phycisphaerales bacterium]